MVNLDRRHWVQAALTGTVTGSLAAGLAGCSSATLPDAAQAPPAPRRILGGFLVPAQQPPGLLPRMGAGAFVRLQSPVALALRGLDLLVADAASHRLWRLDLALQTLTPVAGAPVGPRTTLLLGPDRSAWVLDPPLRQLLRFGIDGRLLQSWRTGGQVPVGLALLDGGATVVVGDTAWAQWTELRSGGALSLAVLPRHGDGARITGVDALAAGAEHLFVLDHAAAALHRVRRDGTVLASATAPALAGASGLAVDRHDRAWLVDGSQRALLGVDVTAAGQRITTRGADELGVQRIGGVAADGAWLAVSDALTGELLLHPLPADEAP